MAFEIPAELRRRGAAVGVKIGFTYVANFAYPEGELVTTMQAPWNRYPEHVYDLNHIVTAIHVAEDNA